MRTALLLLVFASPARASAARDPRILHAEAEIAKAGTEADATEFRARLEQAQKRARALRGCVVAGRLALDGPGDADAVNAQMMIFPGGYFADAFDPSGAPLGFRAPGYEALDAKPACARPLVWLDLAMKPAPPERLGAVKARLEPARAHAAIYADGAPTNVENAGTDARHACDHYRRCPSLPLPMVSVDADGVLSSTGLAPIVHGLDVSAAGYIESYSTFSVRPGELTDLGAIRLEPAQTLALRWLVSDALPFKGTVHDSTATTGQSWWSEPRPGKWTEPDLYFDQRDGRALLMPSVGPADVFDLGPGTLKSFEASVGRRALGPSGPYRVPVQDGHVYLVHVPARRRWLLLTATTRR